MPSNRPDVAPDVKRQEIRQAARTLFFREGYDQAGMTRIAREAGVAANTLYWYYPGKDELFAAVVGELVDAFLAGLASRDPDESLESTLRWAVETLETARPLIVTVHDKSLTSEAVARVHDHFHQSVEEWMAEVLKKRGMDEDRIPAFINIVTFVVEGLVMHELPRAEKEAVMHQLASG